MPSTPINDILLVGFGGVGAIYSYTLKKSGSACVTAVAHSNYDAVKSEGVTFHSQKYGEITGFEPDRRTCQVCRRTADEPSSYVFVTTKAVPEVTKTSDILGPLLSAPYADTHPQPTYVVVQNGLGVERELYDPLLKTDKGAPSIISTALYIGANLVAPNVVGHNNIDRLVIGSYRHKDYNTTTNSPEEAKLLQDIGDILKAGRTTVAIAPAFYGQLLVVQNQILGKFQTRRS